MLPSQQVLEQIARKIRSIPNRRKESKRGIHCGLFLLGYKSGLRVNEAVSFDLNAKTHKGLYRINKPKGKKERFVYVSKEIVRELKKQNWQPNQTNRFNFYHFLRKIKRELNIRQEIELTPHTLRRAFATYHAEKGMPLPLLQKFLGHSSIRTTALYWQNIYGDDDPSDILAGKRWLENKEKEPPKLPSGENSSEPLPNNFEPVLKNKPIITTEKPNNSLPTIENKKIPAISYQSKLKTSEISPNSPEKLLLENQPSKQLPTEKEVLLERIRVLEEQLAKVQTENSNLKLENKHLKGLIRQDQETENKILQILPFKARK